MRFSGMMLLLVTEQNKFAMLGFCIDGTKPTGSEEQNIMSPIFATGRALPICTYKRLSYGHYTPYGSSPYRPSLSLSLGSIVQLLPSGGEERCTQQGVWHNGVLYHVIRHPPERPLGWRSDRLCNLS